MRFAIAGSTVSFVYLLTTTLLATVLGVAFQVALIVGFCAGVLVHFTLQRSFVWVHDDGFALAPSHQVARYLLAAGCQYGLTAASTSLLPAALGLPTEAVYVATVALVTLLNFLVFRHLIFHAKPRVADSR
ncbi:MAG TPA: GtrA family protein [Solirubrobacteraceae bacterium]|jgi:putative flippase GtrA